LIFLVGATVYVDTFNLTGLPSSVVSSDLSVRKSETTNSPVAAGRSERISVPTDSELYFNQAEYAVGIAPPAWHESDLDSSVFLHRNHDSEDII